MGAMGTEYEDFDRFMEQAHQPDDVTRARSIAAIPVQRPCDCCRMLSVDQRAGVRIRRLVATMPPAQYTDARNRGRCQVFGRCPHIAQRLAATGRAIPRAMGHAVVSPAALSAALDRFVAAWECGAASAHVKP
jgi:hypothetical protein